DGVAAGPNAREREPRGGADRVERRLFLGGTHILRLVMEADLSLEPVVAGPGERRVEKGRVVSPVRQAMVSSRSPELVAQVLVARIGEERGDEALPRRHLPGRLEEIEIAGVGVLGGLPREQR